MGPPASASGVTWPMQAPVETPLKRASVITATCLPKSQVAQGGGDLIGLFHARAHGAAAHQHEDVARLDAAGLDGAAWRPSRCGRRAPGRCGGRRRSSSTTVGSMEVLLMTEPPGARLPLGNVTVEVRPRRRAPSGSMMTSPGSTPSRSRRRRRSAARRSDCSHQSSSIAERHAADGARTGVEQAGAAEVQHALRGRLRRGRPARWDGPWGRWGGRRRGAAPGG